ncbi:contact-dependent growth inhibition system immunity protein [Terriglobus albidus]|uniref:contact-dependent growth inhibition system immunity protein n=1 Tax=Terriglobus albidus TaxID=1592106 RepID=UPI00164E993C
MSELDEFRLLRKFFGAYFHEDWLCEADTTEAVVDDFARWKTPEELRTVSNAIRMYSTRYSDGKELERRLFTELRCYYLPSADGLTAKAWLESVADRLSQGIPN